MDTVVYDRLIELFLEIANIQTVRMIALIVVVLIFWATTSNQTEDK